MEEDKIMMQVVPASTEFMVSFKFDADSINGLKTGMELQAEDAWLESCKIVSITPDPEDPRNSKIVKCAITAEYILPGESVTVVANRSNSDYDYCIASSAINEDNSGAFVYVIEEVRSPFGNCYTVKRSDVEVLATDGATSAISGNGIDQNMIVIRSEEALEDGQRVRLEDYSGK